METRVPVALLLEDEPSIALDVEQTLADAGFDVTAMSSCSDAFDWLMVCRPDVVIVDTILRDGQGAPGTSRLPPMVARGDSLRC